MNICILINMKLYTFILIFFLSHVSISLNCIITNHSNSTNCNNHAVCYYFITQCQNNFVPETTDQLAFIIGLILTISIMIMYYLLICYGFGVCRETYENLQLICLISVSLYYEKGLQIVTITNIGIPRSDFMKSVGAQYIVIIIISILFYLMLNSIQDITTHNSYATLFKRKTIIFPFRIYTNFYNIFVYCALFQMTKMDSTVNDLASSIFAILAIIYQVLGFLSLLILINLYGLKNDDPRHYLICEKQIGNRFEKKNQIILSLVNRFIIIATFVFAYKDNSQATIVIIILSQSLYAIYYGIFIKFTKIRYHLLNLFSNIMMIPILLCALLNTPPSTIVWMVFMFIYLFAFMLYLGIEIFANMMQIKRQIRSIYYRFILCQSAEQDILLNKYDSGYNKEKVEEFVDNPLHNKELKEINLEYGL